MEVCSLFFFFRTNDIIYTKNVQEWTKPHNRPATIMWFKFLMRIERKTSHLQVKKNTTSLTNLLSHGMKQIHKKWQIKNTNMLVAELEPMTQS